MEEWFERTIIGRYTAEREKQFFTHYLERFAPCGVQTVVQQGGEWLRSSENVVAVPRDVLMAANAIA